MNKKMLIKIVATVIVLWVLSLIWCGLEILFYGHITHRIVDDIVLLMFIPFVWNSKTVDIWEEGAK